MWRLNFMDEMKNQKEKSFQINQSANTDNKNYGKQIKS